LPLLSFFLVCPFCFFTRLAFEPLSFVRSFVRSFFFFFMTQKRNSYPRQERSERGAVPLEEVDVRGEGECGLDAELHFVFLCLLARSRSLLLPLTLVLSLSPSKKKRKAAPFLSLIYTKTEFGSREGIEEESESSEVLNNG